MFCVPGIGVGAKKIKAHKHTMPYIDKEEANTTSTQPAHKGGRHEGQHGQVDVPGQDVV